MVGKSTLFPDTFFDAISLVEISTLFSLTFFDVTLMVEKPTLIPLTFSTKFRWAKIRRRFWLKCKLIKTLEEVFLC